MKNFEALALVMLMTLCGSSLAMIQPAIPLKDLDPVDACLFACHMCYEKEFLLSCANKVCLGDLMESHNGKDIGISSFWTKTCPGLAMFARRK